MVSAMVKSSLRKHEKTDKSFVIYIFIVILPIFIFLPPKHEIMILKQIYNHLIIFSSSQFFIFPTFFLAEW